MLHQYRVVRAEAEHVKTLDIATHTFSCGVCFLKRLIAEVRGTRGALDWPTDHSWFIGAIDLSDIWLIDIYGGAKTLDIDSYYAADLKY